MKKALKDFLEKEQVAYEVIKHDLAYTAQETAAAEHIPGRRVTKTVIVRADGEPKVLVLSADHLVDFAKLKKVLSCRKVVLATEEEIAQIFPGYEVGAIPPFASLIDVPLYIDEQLAGNDEVSVNACSHTEAVILKYSDFERLSGGCAAAFGKHI